MKKKLILLPLSIFLVFFAGCTRVILNADFNTDTIDNPPATSPAGEPADDKLNLQGSAASIIVIQSLPLNSKALKCDRTSGSIATKFEAIVGNGLHDKGIYYISFKACAVADQSNLVISLRSTTDKRALVLTLRNNQYRLTSSSGTELLPGTYTIGSCHSIYIQLNPKTGKFSMKIDGNSVAAAKSVLDPDFKDIHLLRYEYAPAILEAFPGVLVIDDILIKKKVYLN